jgi:hypothetical protein
MNDDKKKTFKKGVIESLYKVNGLLQQSLLEIAQLIKNVDVVGTAKKISDPKKIESIGDGLKKLADADFPRVMIKHAISDFQLKDLFSTVEAFIAKVNPASVDMPSKETLPKEISTNETLSKEAPSEKVRVKKPRSKKISPKKTVSKKTPSKKKTKRSFKRKVRTPS